MLDLAQETIGFVERLILGIGQTADAFEGTDRFQRIGLAQGGEVAAIGELQELDGEFDIANAAVAGLDFGVALAELARLLFDLSLERLDLVNLGDAEVTAIDEWLNGANELLAQLGVACDRANLDERLTFPGSAHRVVIG